MRYTTNNRMNFQQFENPSAMTRRNENSDEWKTTWKPEKHMGITIVRMNLTDGSIRSVGGLQVFFKKYFYYILHLKNRENIFILFSTISTKELGEYALKFDFFSLSIAIRLFETIMQSKIVHNSRAKLKTRMWAPSMWCWTRKHSLL